MECIARIVVSLRRWKNLIKFDRLLWFFYRRKYVLRQTAFIDHLLFAFTFTRANQAKKAFTNLTQTILTIHSLSNLICRVCNEPNESYHLSDRHGDKVLQKYYKRIPVGTGKRVYFYTPNLLFFSPLNKILPWLGRNIDESSSFCCRAADARCCVWLAAPRGGWVWPAPPRGGWVWPAAARSGLVWPAEARGGWVWPTAVAARGLVWLAADARPGSSGRRGTMGCLSRLAGPLEPVVHSNVIKQGF